MLVELDTGSRVVDDVIPELNTLVTDIKLHGLTKGNRLEKMGRDSKCFIQQILLFQRIWGVK